MHEEEAGFRILAVEDSASARKVFHKVLIQLGIAPENLRWASDAREALHQASEWEPDVVFLDVELRPSDPAPGDGPSGESTRSAAMNGDELGRHLLKLTPRPKIVVVSALDPDDLRVKALLRDGAVAAIVKPVLSERVHEVLRSLGVLPPGAARPSR